MALILDLIVQGAQMVLVLALAPLLTGFIRKVKARLNRRQGPPLLQPYRDLTKLLHKEVILAENARIPVDNPATHLELTMVHEAMILEYSGRHLAVVELAGSLKLLLYLSLIACVFLPWSVAPAGAGFGPLAHGFLLYVVKLAVGGGLLGFFETTIAKMRVFRVPDFLGAGLMLGILAVLLLFVTRSVR